MAKILIAEDNNQMREMMMQMMLKEGYEVTAAPDGEAALRAVKKFSFDLVITDIVMPEKEGLQTIMELKSMLPDLKIIAVSGGGNYLKADDYLKMAGMIGAESILRKPFKREQLIGIVKKLLGEPVGSLNKASYPGVGNSFV